MKRWTYYDHGRMDHQAAETREIFRDYAKDYYTFDKPFIKLDPFDRTPLSALVMFETDSLVQIEITTGAGNGELPITLPKSDFHTEHVVPVLGLYPNKVNEVMMHAYDKDGNKQQSTTISITTDPLPSDIPNIDIISSDPVHMEEGLTFITPSESFLYAFDKNGDVRWYSTLKTKLIFSKLSNGLFIVGTKKADDTYYKDILEMNLLGKIYRAYRIDMDGYADNPVHHEVVELPNHNLLMTVDNPDSDYVEDVLIEVDHESGHTVRVIDLKNAFPEEAYTAYNGLVGKERNDWLHQNAVFFDHKDHSILISGRHQDTVIKLSYPDAEVEWMLAAHEAWPDAFKSVLLDPVNDVKFPAGQHAVKVLPDMDGNPDTMDILLFDNNHVITRGDKDVSDAFSRIVQYRINEKERTVEEIWSYGEELGKMIFSPVVGNAQLLPDTGNRLMTSGFITPNAVKDDRISRIFELNDKENPDTVFEVTLSGFTKESRQFAYRASRWKL